MEQFSLDHSTKDIPEPVHKVFLNMFINSIETLVYGMDWAAQFFFEPSSKTAKETFNLKSNKKPPNRPELMPFKNDLLDIAKSIKFKSRPNKFQTKLKREKDTIVRNDKLIIPADKTSNHYEVDPTEYKKFVMKEVNKEYKLEKIGNIKKINNAHKVIVNDLEVQDRVFKTVEREAFISLKDHKPDFQNAPKSRLLNPTKPDIGKISHRILSKIVNVVRAKSKLNQWKNVYGCIDWFRKLNHKSYKSFISFDIVNFYPSISEDLLNKSLNWAQQFIDISESERLAIFEARKSFLFFNGRYWSKKSNPNFDVPMGAFDGAEVCDICGLYILSLLEKLNLNVSFGSYKDDGLAACRATPRVTEQYKKQICETFRKLGLQITIEANKKSVQFLDAEFNLEEGSFKPFLKPGDKPVYVNAKSNHPPAILRNIPKSINRRLSALSSDVDKFNSVSPIYQEALNKAGYNFQLEYNPPPQTAENSPPKRCRKRKEFWFNPPFSTNVETKIGQAFFQVVEKHFGKSSNNPLKKIFNKRTIKLSYRTTPNFKAIISSHNKRLLGGRTPDLPCNCKKKNRVCPLDGQCKKKNIIYGATVTPSQGQIETYVGLTSTTFKERYGNHLKSFNHEKYSTETSLSKFIWKLKEKNLDYQISWRILDRASIFNPSNRICGLCTLEKYYIMFRPDLSTLNLREEVFKPCPHKHWLLLDNT